MRHGVLVVAPVVALLAGRLLSPGLAVAEGPGASEARGLDRAVPRAVERAAPSVVRIRPSVPADDPLTLARKTRTGTAVAPDLVIADALSVATFGVEDLVVETLDGKVRKARMKGRDLRLRLVALDVPDGGLVPIPFARRLPDSGTIAIALGSVLGGPHPQATFGFVSAPSRFEGRAFETDATIDPANAGGPVVDLEGRLLGISVVVDRRIGDGSGVGFAVPVARVEPVLGRLRKGDEIEQGMLGVILPTDVPAGKDLAGGVPIEAVKPGGPAAKAGLQAGDVIVAVDLDPAKPGDASRVRGIRALVTRLSFACAGDTVRVTVRRGLEEKPFDVVLGRR